jgi:NAD(P)-dependent dehydrogenase (short-subunit alcohol dehydrogenase family)
MVDFTGKVALVTGSAGGIGRASALAFARRGAAVIVCDVADGINETVAQIKELGGQATPALCDIVDPEAVRDLIDSAVQTYGRLDYAHNNAGIFIPAPLADLDDNDFDRVLKINLSGVFYCMKYQIRQMLEQGGGAIVNTASIWSFAGAGAQAAYAASKHGVMGLTRSAAIDYGGTGIRINAVAPGPIQTAMTAAVPTDAMAQIVNRTVEKRMGQPEEIAEAVVWLCSDNASYVNGTVLPVDGGWLAS